MSPAGKGAIALTAAAVTAGAVFGILVWTGDDEQVAQPPAASPTPATQTIETDLFSIDLPAGWRQIRDEGDNPRRVQFGDGGGRGIVVVLFPEQNPGHSGFSTDVVWRLTFNAAGDGFEVGEKQPPCVPDETNQDFCSAGNGSLDGYALLGDEGERYLGGYEYQFEFGDTSGEDAPTTEFERIIESLRVKAA